MQTLHKIINELGYSFEHNNEVAQLTSALIRKQLDCDTFAYVAVAIGHELGWPVFAVPFPDHFIVRWGDPENGEVVEFSYTDAGLEIDSSNDYREEESITDQDLKNGLVYSKNLDKAGLRATAIYLRAWTNIIRKNYAVALEDYKALDLLKFRHPYVYADSGIAEPVQRT